MDTQRTQTDAGSRTQADDNPWPAFDRCLTCQWTWPTDGAGEQSQCPGCDQPPGTMQPLDLLHTLEILPRVCPFSTLLWLPRQMRNHAAATLP